MDDFLTVAFILLVDCGHVTVEYCFHGNLRDYVTRHREYFINELDPETGELEAGGDKQIKQNEST